MDRRTWVCGMGWNMYVWTHGSFVQVFGFVEYVRRLSGELQDAQPFKVVSVRAFRSVKDFESWCKRDHQAQTEAALPGLGQTTPFRTPGYGNE